MDARGKDTIQTDVPAGEEKQEQALSPRELMLSQIDGRLDEERQGQIWVEPETSQPGEPVLVEDLQQFMVRVKIDGKEETKPLAEVVGGYQKNTVASERLRQASQQRIELEARERALLERENQIQLAATASHEDPGDNDELDLALNALVEGDTTQAAKVIRDMVSKGRQTTTPAVDEAAITAQVESRLSGKNDWENFLRDNPEFREEYNDQGQVILTKERQYGDFVYERDYAKRVENGEISYLEALNATAGEVRKTFSPPPAKEQQTTREAKLERKRALDNLPIAAGARAAGPDAGQDESPSETIADMRRARGLPA